MALIQCHECEKQVSTESKSCPACGATVKLPKPPKQPASKLVLGLLAAMGIATATIVTVNNADVADRNKAEAERIAAMTPEQRAQIKIQQDKQAAAQKAQKDKDAKTYGLALIGAKTLKNNSKDPQTFEFTSIVTKPNSTVCFEYRAKNRADSKLKCNTQGFNE